MSFTILQQVSFALITFTKKTRKMLFEEKINLMTERHMSILSFITIRDHLEVSGLYQVYLIIELIHGVLHDISKLDKKIIKNISYIKYLYHPKENI